MTRLYAVLSAAAMLAGAGCDRGNVLESTEQNRPVARSTNEVNIGARSIITEPAGAPKPAAEWDDPSLLLRVETAIARKNRHVTTSLENKKIVLRGEVETEAEKEALLKEAERFVGVQQIRNELKVGK